MTYHNGEVMQTLAGYTIFWTPNTTMSADYRNLINRYVQDIGGSAFFNINTQYFQNPGPLYIQNNSTSGGTWLDTTNAYPGGRGTGANPLLDQDLRDEVTRALAANPSWGPPGLDRMYFVYTELGIESTDGTNCTGGVTGCTGTQYCAYHWDFTSGGNHVIYANMPYDNTWNNCGRGDIFTSPNGNLDADMEISTTSHEHFESSTDPLGSAWYDCNNGGEDGDKCAYRYGSLATDGHNLVLNGNPYIAQLEWSNADNDGVTAFSGCVKRYNADVDMAVDKSGAPDPVKTGDDLAYTTKVQNLNLGFEGSDLTLTDPVPFGTTFKALISPAGWSCSTPSVGFTGTVSCTKLSLGANATDTLTMVVKTSCSLADGTTLSNTASVGSSSSDPNSANDSATATTTASNPAAVIVCPSDITVECTGNLGTPASDPNLAPFFAGVSATDNCPGVSIANNAPSFFNLGTTPVTFTATDSGGATSSCTANVVIQDTQPPTIGVTLNRSLLWPPNHKLVDITASVTVTDVCDPNASFKLISITSNEPDNGLGDGNTSSDIQDAAYGTADTTFSLRAERSGPGAGRVYTILDRAFDGSGNTADATVTVGVPHSMAHTTAVGAGLTVVGVDPGGRSLVTGSGGAAKPSRRRHPGR